MSKAGGLTPGRRHRDAARAAGLTVSVQDTVGSSLAVAAVLHLGATVPPRSPRGVLDREDMVTRRVDEDALGPPVATWHA